MPTPPKTLHLTNAYHPTSGGISTFYRALLRDAERRGRPMRLVVPGDTSRVEEFGRFARIHYVAAGRSPVADSRYRLLLPILRPGRAVRQILREEQPDLVEVSDKYTLHYVALFLRRRWIRGVRRPVLVGFSHERMDDNVGAYLTRRYLGGLIARLYVRDLYFPIFDWHIANSDYTAEELRDAARRRKDKNKVWTMPIGVDCSDLNPAAHTPAARQHLIQRAAAQLAALADAQFKAQGHTHGIDPTLPPAPKLLLYVGRLAAEKNLPLLVEMMPHLPPNYVLLVAGDGTQAPWLRYEGERRAPGRVKLLGHVRDRAALVSLYAGADAFVHPNPREPFGIAPLEAMAAGLPLVAPPTGGVRSYADPDNAWLAKPTGESFAAAARAAAGEEAGDFEARQQKLRRARAVAERFDWPKVTARYFELYDELIARSRQPGA